MAKKHIKHIKMRIVISIKISIKLENDNTNYTQKNVFKNLYTIIDDGQIPV